MAASTQSDWSGSLEMDPSRPTDLSLVPRSKELAPRQWVWVPEKVGEVAGPIPAGAKQRKLATHEQCILLRNYLRIWHLKGPANGLYVEWELPEDADELMKAFQLMKLHDTWRSLLSTKFYRGINPVYIEAHNGGPFGRFLWEIFDRLEKCKGLFIQALGNM
ncbi:hypothetical protein OQA88_13701 [Cercophora sp. LCS_1]